MTFQLLKWMSLAAHFLRDVSLLKINPPLSVPTKTTTFSPIATS
jgi:hypothetical protein